MSEIYTAVCLPGSTATGWMRRGRLTAQELIAEFRENAKEHKEQAEAILAAPDEAFQVDVIRGCVVQHHLKTVQQSSIKEN